MDPAQPDTDRPLAGHARRFEEMFRSMMELAARRESRWEAELEDAPLSGPCPGCGRPGQALDHGESLERSTMHDRLAVVFRTCPHCEAEARTRAILRGYGVPPRVVRATFDGYETPDPRMAAARDAVRAWCRDDARTFLLLLGGTGTGKGHLAAAAVRELRQTTTWITHADLIDGYLAAGLERQPGYLGRLKRVPLLVLDEMGAQAPKPSTAEIFYKLLDARYEAGLRTILIGNIPLRPKSEGRIGMLGLIGGERMDSRLAMVGTVLTCAWGDWRRRDAGLAALPLLLLLALFLIASSLPLLLFP